MLATYVVEFEHLPDAPVQRDFRPIIHVDCVYFGRSCEMGLEYPRVWKEFSVAPRDRAALHSQLVSYYRERVRSGCIRNVTINGESVLRYPLRVRRAPQRYGDA